MDNNKHSALQTVTDKRMYSDPSAAHEHGLKMKSKGAYRVVITPAGGKFQVVSLFRDSNAGYR